MDTYGFPFSSDDEEEYTPPQDDNDQDNGKDKYILELVPEVIPLTENIYNMINMETSTIAERTRARGNQPGTCEPEIMFDGFPGMDMETDEALNGKEEYRKFVEGVYFNNQDNATNTTDGEDGDDEDYIPPKKEIALDKSSPSIPPLLPINKISRQIRKPLAFKSIAPRSDMQYNCPVITSHLITLNPAQRVVLQTQFMCFGQLVIQLYLLCSRDSSSQHLLTTIRSLVMKMHAVSIPEDVTLRADDIHIPTVRDTLRQLNVFHPVVMPVQRPVHISAFEVVDCTAIEKVFDTIDRLYQIKASEYENGTLPSFTSRSQKTQHSLEEDSIYMDVMSSMDMNFEPKLKPNIKPANILGGYGSSGRLQFTPSEDALLALGMYCGLLGDDYKQIQKHMLITKTKDQLKNRSKNQRNHVKGKLTIIKQFSTLFSDFSSWGDDVYFQICNIISAHTSWKSMQRIYFPLKSDIVLRFFWLYKYFKQVKNLLDNRPDIDIPFFLITPFPLPNTYTTIHPTVSSRLRIILGGYLFVARIAPNIPIISDHLNEIYEKDDILSKNIKDLTRKRQVNESESKVDENRSKPIHMNSIEREELSDDDV